MDPHRWDTLRELFLQARDLDPAERAAFVRDHCADDATLRSELLALLAAHDQPGLEMPDVAGPDPTDEDAGDALDGITIGDYRGLETIGEGGMGRVYRAFDVRLERYVALKMLPDELARDPRRVARFKQEARILASLNHPNIGAIYDVESHEGHLVLVLELAEGPTLADRLASGALPIDDAIAIAHQVASALEVAHAKGIVHRDLKPANVALTADGSVKLLDFGIAKAPERPVAPSGRTPTDDLAATREGQRLGTVSYMSPEQIRGFHIDTRSDVWSFGVVLFQMLAGTRPFQADSQADIFARILERSPDWDLLPRRTPANLRTLLERCLEKNARQRLQAIGEARLALESSAARPTPQSDDRPRHRALWLTAVLAAAALALLVTGQLISDRPDPTAEPRGTAVPTQVSFTGDVIEAVIGPTGPLVATIRQLGLEQVLTVFDMTGGPSVDVARGSSFCCLEWSPDANRIAFRRSTGGPLSLHTVPARGGLERDVGIHSIWMTGPTWSPDGSRLADWHVPAARPIVRTTDLGSGDVIWYESPEVRDNVRFVTRIDWGPTGDFLVVSQDLDGQFRVHVMEGEGGVPGSLPGFPSEHIGRMVSARLLATHDEEIRGAYWATEEAVYYLLVKGRTWDLMRVDPSVPDAPPEVVRPGLQIVDNEMSFVNFAVSRDGLVSFANGLSYTNLWVVPFDEADPARPITAGTRMIRRPIVSPEGDRVAFEAASSARPDIFVLDLQNGETRQVTRTRTGAVSAAWSPSGDTIAFITGDAGRPGVWTTDLDGRQPGSLQIGEVHDVGWRLLEWAPGSDLLVQLPDLSMSRHQSAGPGRPLTPGLAGWALQPRYSPDGQTVAVLHNNGREVSLALIGNDGSPREVLSGQYYPIGWSPDGSLVYAYQRAPRRILSVDPMTGRFRLVRTFPFRSNEMQIDLLRDASGVVAAVEESPADAVVVDLATGR